MNKNRRKSLWVPLCHERQRSYVRVFYLHASIQNVQMAIQTPSEMELKSYQWKKSVSYENRYTELIYEFEGGKDDYLNAAGCRWHGEE
jgi:hypothetical protein